MNRFTDENYDFSTEKTICGTTENIRLFKILKRLQSYENTGFEPEEVAMLKAKDKKNDSIMGDLMRAICAEQAENAELKRLLRLAVDELYGLCNVCQYGKDMCMKCVEKLGTPIKDNFRWRYADEAEKMLEESENTSETKSCEVCCGKKVLYQETRDTKLYINTQGKARALYTEDNSGEVTSRAAFIINYCPHCGRKLGDIAERELGR